MLLAELLESLVGLVGTDEVVHVSDVGEDVGNGSEQEPLRHVATAVSRAAGLAAGRRLVVHLHRPAAPRPGPTATSSHS